MPLPGCCDVTGEPSRCGWTFGKLMVKRTREQAQATRAIIVESAQGVFFDHGFAHASLEEIARRAGVTRGAVYWHFESKLDVLDAIFADAAIPLDPFLIPPRQDAAHALDALIDSLGACWRAATRSKLSRRLYTLSYTRCESAGETAAFCERVRQAACHAEQRIEACVRRAIAAGQLASEHEPAVIASVVHATLSGLLRRELTRPGRRNPDMADITEIVRTLIQG
ncbi:TetR family transcriptional regulator [Burkholderia sp. Ac-20349]|uniref:TetR family transcriptional regulator n=1 Tax=Burkholderia sp. Ac-20349 TaxID=2703893 RepID=UPI00197CB169|nr:TetR family transcriptional regulator [Burkholderia sp. Ac-20349]MBN3840300.1 TetR family transcriptional regulator [Burkholderia sp. Ac-20349]